MQLSLAEFERRYAENRLKIAFVGMSNIGKSYTASRLAKALDFKLIEVDRLIWEALGQDSMADFAAWQGQPYSQGYSEREAKSIALESEATKKAISLQAGNTILDTTGSVIYTDELVQKNLINDWYIVYISASQDVLEILKQQYFNNPKPLIWNGHYTAKSGQSPDEAILESYPKLLASRAQLYAELADQTINSSFVLDPNQSAESLFQALKPAR